MLLLRSAGVLVVGIALSGSAVASSQSSASRGAASAGCGFLRVDFKPEGSGGAMNIKTSRIACGPARQLVTRCVAGKVSSGWTVVTDTRTLMTKDAQRITYTPVGGGGCGAFTKSCADFSYRAVGFFNMHVLGPGCSRGQALARSWYGSSGRCSFAKTCTLGTYRCVPSASRATVTCRRGSNGYRVDWQMGE
jgi:hypothetical protein